jgi:hypothetical protein
MKELPHFSKEIEMGSGYRAEPKKDLKHQRDPGFSF